MNCFVHEGHAATGTCAACRKALCGDCVGQDAPRLICKACVSRGAVYGYEYKSEAQIGGWPLVHICMGMDAVTMRPKIAKGVIAIGNIAVGGLAVGGVALGCFTFGGLSVGLLLAIGGAALGLGLSLGGLAVGSIAFGGMAVGFIFAVGGGAVGGAVIDGQHCSEAAREFLAGNLPFLPLPPSCR